MWDTHSSIINSDTEIVYRLSVTPHNHKVTKCIQVPTDLHNTITSINSHHTNKNKEHWRSIRCVRRKVIWKNHHCNAQVNIELTSPRIRSVIFRIPSFGTRKRYVYGVPFASSSWTSLSEAVPHFPVYTGGSCNLFAVSFICSSSCNNVIPNQVKSDFPNKIWQNF